MSIEASASLLKKRLSRIQWGDISEDYLHSLISCARLEDIEGYGLKKHPQHSEDVSSAISGVRGEMKAHLVAREPLVVCGLLLIAKILEIYGGNAVFTPQTEDGSSVKATSILGSLAGDALTILAAERVILNFIQRLSGIASNTHRYVEQMEHSPTKLLDTRKTTPGWRVLEK
ncbi:MAG: hypothetical protein B7X06_03145, partial [Verrucomicrobia bacterium 21-51-4]